MPDRVGNVIAPPATFVATEDVSTNASATSSYVDRLNSYLGVVIGEGRRLSALGQARSRNVLELSVRMDRFREASAELKAYMSSHAPPADLESEINDLLIQLENAESAIQASITAVQGFDWEALGGSVDDFSRAVEAIEALSLRINE